MASFTEHPPFTYATSCDILLELQYLSRDSSVVRAPDSWLKGLCWLLFWYLFLPRVTAVACKRSRSFYRKCRWQVTAKGACTLRMWLCMKWHGAWLHGLYRTRRDGSSSMWHQPCQRCKYTTSVDIQKTAALWKASRPRRITCKRSESARERNILRYIKAISNNNIPMLSKCLKMNVSGLLRLSLRPFLGGARLTGSIYSPAGKGLRVIRL